MLGTGIWSGNPFIEFRLCLTLIWLAETNRARGVLALIYIDIGDLPCIRLHWVLLNTTVLGTGVIDPAIFQCIRVIESSIRCCIGPEKHFS